MIRPHPLPRLLLGKEYYTKNKKKVHLNALNIQKTEAE